MRSISKLVSVFLAIVIMVTNCLVDLTVSASGTFTVKYYEDDDKYNAGKTTGNGTVVECDNELYTKTQTVQQLGYKQVGRVFMYWKAHRSYDDTWYVESDSKKEWKALENGKLPSGYDYVRFGNSAGVRKLAAYGDVHFIAQWDTSGNEIIFYDSQGGKQVGTTTLKYNIQSDIPTAKELNLSKAGKVFVGWKAQRVDNKQWAVKDQNGGIKWVASPSTNDELFIYSDGITLSGFYQSGKINFYAQWIDTYFDISKLGANGKDNADDSLAIQKALDYAKNTDEKVTVFVPAGNYFIVNTLFIYSNTELVLDEKATITCLGETRLMLMNLSKSSDYEGGYGRSENISVRGGKWDGNGKAGNKHNNLFFFVHAKNITIKDTTMLNCCGNHYIEFAAVKDSIISNCIFKDYVLFKGINYTNNENDTVDDKTGMSKISEAVQLDYATEVNTDGGAKPFDNTPCRNVTVTKCTFENCLCGIGNHHEGSTCLDYRFTDNTFKNINRNCFNLFSMGGVEISGNTATDVFRFVNVYKSNGGKEGDILVKSNKIINSNEQYTDISSCMLLKESNGITISDNSIGGFTIAIESDNNAKLLILGNSISDIYQIGIKIIDTSCNINNNIVINCGLYNIATYKNCSGKIENNKYDISYGIFNAGKMNQGINQFKDFEKEPDYFTVYYHCNDTAPSSSITTKVRVGTQTKYQSIEELGYYTNGKKFLGWKIYNKAYDCWLVKDPNGEQSWQKSAPKGGSFVLYSDGGDIASTASAGGEVHFYAQWEDTNLFTIYYHSNESKRPNQRTTNVKYGTATKYLTREEIGYWINGKAFLGWKVYRCDTKCWLVKNASGKTSWAKSVPQGGGYELLADGGTVSDIVNAGADVHFYAQWKDTDSFTIYYHENDTAEKNYKSTSVKYGISTKYLTIEQLGFKRVGQKFVGWKLYRGDNTSWYVQDSKGELSWAKSVPQGGKYCLYNDGGSVAKTDVPGGEVHFYAVWEKTDEVYRIAGINRFSTASAISQETFSKTETVVIAYGLNYADALAGVPLAFNLNAPILLSNKDVLPDETLAEIKRLKATKVIILGGTGVISKKVENSLKSAGIKEENINRIAGQTRFSTATAIAERLNDKPSDVFFVYGLNYADALSVGSVAALKKAPIIYLTKDGDLNADTLTYLSKLKSAGSVKNAYIIGGKGVITDSMMKKAYTALGLKKATRVAGTNRFTTCIEVNKAFADTLNGSSICVATGMDFPDALAGGVYAAKNKAPLFLVNGKAKTAVLLDEQIAYLKCKKPQSVSVFGGIGAVPTELTKSLIISQ